METKKKYGKPKFFAYAIGEEKYVREHIHKESCQDLFTLFQIDTIINNPKDDIDNGHDICIYLEHGKYFDDKDIDLDNLTTMILWLTGRICKALTPYLPRNIELEELRLDYDQAGIKIMIKDID